MDTNTTAACRRPGRPRSPLRALVLSLAAVVGTLASAAAAMAADEGRKGDYWLLVTFAASGKPEEMDILKDTTFEGIALQIVTAYDTAATPTTDSVMERFGKLKEAGHRDIWPWVFINRIAKMDVSPDGAPRQLFLEDWRVALQVARRLDAPGVVLDLEFYSNPGLAYAISRFAAQTGTSAAEAAQRLEALGHEMAASAAREYPNVRIWVLTSGLNTANDERVGGQSFYQPRAHIVLGLLQELARTRGAATVIDGGEDTLAYCHANLADLQRAINQRPQKEAQVLAQYRYWLAFAGTIAPWTDAASKKGWLAESDCGAAQARTAEDFLPYFELLERTYAFNWMYAAPIGGYQPFNRDVSRRFDTLLRRARGQSPREPAQ
jgi:hypothetical protein